MPANKTNYVVIYRNESQVYASGSKDIALETPPPSGVPLEDKRVFFITYQPDNEMLSVHKIPDEEVQNATLKHKKKKTKEADK